MKNCMNCGAPVSSSKCEFCGTRYDITVITSVQPVKHIIRNYIETYDASKTYMNGDLVSIRGNVYCVLDGLKMIQYY